MDIGIVLAGGMAKGAYQIGALRAIEQFVPHEHIRQMSCASIGVLNGYAFATNQMEAGREIWLDMCKGEDNFFITQVLRSDYLQNGIREIYRPDAGFDMDFYVSLVDLSNCNIAYKNLRRVKNTNVPLYLQAAVAMPVCNRPVKVGRTYYYDGAMVDNIPVFPFREQKLDYQFCIYFDDNYYIFENPEFDSRIIKIMYPHKNFIRQSLYFNRASIEEMMRDGYEQTSYLLDSVMSSGFEDLEHIYKAIAHHNRTLGNQKIRVTGDVIVTNLNKVVQKLVKRKILK